MLVGTFVTRTRLLYRFVTAQLDFTCVLRVSLLEVLIAFLLELPLSLSFFLTSSVSSLFPFSFFFLCLLLISDEHW